jgi:hypothetical protein
MPPTKQGRAQEPAIPETFVCHAPLLQMAGRARGGPRLFRSLGRWLFEAGVGVCLGDDYVADPKSQVIVGHRDDQMDGSNR